MKKIFYVATLFSCSINPLSLHAFQSAVTSPNLPASTKDASTGTTSYGSTASTEVKKGGAQGAIQPSNSTSTNGKSTEIKKDNSQGTNNQADNGNKDQMPEWMLESAQVSKEYVNALDNGQYVQSWTKGDQLFQHTITQDEWVQALNASRKELGKAKSRTLKIQRPAWNPKGLPPGPYMVVEFETTFANGAEAGELLTLRRGTDGKWRVLTYQVH